MSFVAVAAHKMYRGFTPERQEVPYAYEVLDVAEALTRKYETDAHLVTYVVRGHYRQPRINKAGLEYFPHPAEVDVFFCDVDNPDHADWDKDSMEAALERYAIVEPLETAGIYLTAHGSRIVQPLAKAIPVPEVEPYLARWLGQLEEVGINVDWACRDWTRHFRLPHVIRDKGEYTSPHVDLAFMRPIELEPIENLDGTAKRLFGPLSLFDADGAPVCKYYEIAEPLVEGGQSMQWELCEGRKKYPCEHAETCPAKKGVEGPRNARIALGTHGLMSKLKKHAGTTGLTIIDEPPHLIETIELTTDDFHHTLDNLYAFESRFADAMKPSVEALRQWTERLAPLKDIFELRTVLDRAQEYVPVDMIGAASLAAETEDSIRMCVVHAPLSDYRSDAPPLTNACLAAAKHSLELACKYGRASKVLHLLRRGLTLKAHVVLRLEERNGRRTLLVTLPREQLMRTLNAAGPIVITDANAKLHVETLKRIVGYPPTVHEFTAADGAPVTRTFIRNKTATRKAWRKGSDWLVNDKLVGAVKAVFDWTKEDSSAKELAIITFKPVAVMLEAVLDPWAEEWENKWVGLGQHPDTLALARKKLGPIVKSWPGAVILAHYGNLRGLNFMKGVDALATLGDPWHQLGDIQNETAYLGIDDKWTKRVEELCRAELEQAHGRLRTIHRTKPARALHVGNILPSGRAWTDGSAEIRWSKGGRRCVNDTLIPEEELQAIVQELGGQRAVGRLLGCDHKMVSRYLKGQPMKQEMAERLLAKHQKVSAQPAE
jgi:hypothetical protein